MGGHYRPLALHPSALSPREYEYYQPLLVSTHSVESRNAETLDVQQCWKRLVPYLGEIDDRIERDILSLFRSPSSNQQTKLTASEGSTTLALLRLYSHTNTSRNLTRDHCFLQHDDPVQLQTPPANSSEISGQKRLDNSDNIVANENINSTQTKNPYRTLLFPEFVPESSQATSSKKNFTAKGPPPIPPSKRQITPTADNTTQNISPASETRPPNPFRSASGSLPVSLPLSPPNSISASSSPSARATTALNKLPALPPRSPVSNSSDTTQPTTLAPIQPPPRRSSKNSASPTGLPNLPPRSKFVSSSHLGLSNSIHSISPTPSGNNSDSNSTQVKTRASRSGSAVSRTSSAGHAAPGSGYVYEKAASPTKRSLRGSTLQNSPFSIANSSIPSGEGFQAQDSSKEAENLARATKISNRPKEFEQFTVGNTFQPKDLTQSTHSAAHPALARSRTVPSKPVPPPPKRRPNEANVNPFDPAPSPPRRTVSMTSRTPQPTKREMGSILGLSGRQGEEWLNKAKETIVRRTHTNLGKTGQDRERLFAGGPAEDDAASDLSENEDEIDLRLERERDRGEIVRELRNQSEKGEWEQL